MSELVHVTRGIWRPRVVVADLIGRVAAILAAYPPNTVVAGRTAAQLHGLWLPQWVAEQQIVELIIHPDVRRPADRCASYRAGVRARRQTLARDEVVRLDGLPVTSEGRTWLDLAAVLPPADLVACGDSALRGAADETELEALVRRADRRRGVVRARQVLPLLDGRSRSRPESHLRYAIVSAGLPLPAVNEPIYTDRGEWLAEPDLSYGDVLLALEYNGRDHAELQRMRRDLTRGIGISSARWRTESFGPIEVFQRPDQIAVLVRQLRAERAHLARAAR